MATYAETCACSWRRTIMATSKYKVYDSGFRGQCPSETVEQVTFVARIRSKYPHTYGALLFHVRNEGKKTVQQVQREKLEGMTTGTADIIIPGSPTFVCEMKRRDRTKSRVSPDQVTYLEAAVWAGAFACVAYGCDEAEKAFRDWLEITNDCRLP